MDRTLYCCHCTVEGFPDVYKMRKHYRNSHGGLKVVCTVCFNQFRRQEDLEDHAEEYHQKKSERLIISCIHCPRMFLYKFGLKCHNGVVHDKLQLSHITIRMDLIVTMRKNRHMKTEKTSGT